MSQLSYWKDGVFHQEIDGVLRRKEPAGDGVRRTWHANGVLESEWTKVDGKTAGLTREWHDNGQLAFEKPYKNGLAHGIAKQWSREGNLLGEYEMKMGCGIERKWNDDGSLDTETERFGHLRNRTTIWDDLNKPHSTFMWDGQRVSQKKFHEKLADAGILPTSPTPGETQEKKRSKSRRVGSNLPNANRKAVERDKQVPGTEYQKRQSSVPENELKLHNETIAKFRSKPNQAETMQWLTEGKPSTVRNLGEMTPEMSYETIKEGYAAGAKKIIAVDIGSDGRNESTNYLIVELPVHLSKRQRVFEWVNELAVHSGFDPNEDWGQNELFVFFD